MTNLNELNDRIIEIQDQQIQALEKCRKLDAIVHEGEMSRAAKRIKDLEADVLHWSSEYEKQKELYEGAVKHVADERDEAIALANELKKDVQHWQNQFDREHNAFVQAANDRDQALRDKGDLRRRNRSLRECNEKQQEQLEIATSELEQALTSLAARDADVEYLTSVIENICSLSADEADIEDVMEICIAYRRHSDPYGKYMVYVVEHQGDDKVFTGWFHNYDLARESVDLMTARGCYEAWVEERYV